MLNTQKPVTVVSLFLLLWTYSLVLDLQSVAEEHTQSTEPSLNFPHNSPTLLTHRFFFPAQNLGGVGSVVTIRIPSEATLVLIS